MGLAKEIKVDRWPAWRHITLQRFLWLSILLIVIVAVTNPTLPVPVTVMQKAFYDKIEATRKGGNVLVGFHIENFYRYDTMRDAFMTLIIQLARNNLKFVMASVGSVTPLAFEDVVKRANVEKTYGYKYGVDYVILPFLAGEEVAMASIATDIHAAYSADNRGNPLSSLLLMQKIHSMNDFDLTITYTHVDSVGPMFVRQWAVKYPKVPFITMGGGPMAAYFGTSVLGICEPNAQYESMVGIPGEELTKLQASNVARLLTFSMIIFAAIKFQIDRVRTKVKVEEKV